MHELNNKIMELSNLNKVFFYVSICFFVTEPQVIGGGRIETIRRVIPGGMQ